MVKMNVDVATETGKATGRGFYRRHEQCQR